MMNGIKNYPQELGSVETGGFKSYMHFIREILMLRMQAYNLVGLELHGREESETVHGLLNQQYILRQRGETTLMGQFLLITSGM